MRVPLFNARHSVSSKFWLLACFSGKIIIALLWLVLSEYRRTEEESDSVLENDLPIFYNHTQYINALTVLVYITLSLKDVHCFRRFLRQRIPFWVSNKNKKVRELLTWGRNCFPHNIVSHIILFHLKKHDEQISFITLRSLRKHYSESKQFLSSWLQIIMFSFITFRKSNGLFWISQNRRGVIWE